MQKKALLLIVGLSLLVVGCSSKKDTLEVRECNFPDSPETSAPLWVCGGAVEGVEVSAVGSAVKSKASIHFMQQQATANARLVLAQQLQSDIQAKVKNFTEAKGIGEEESIEQISSLVSEQITNKGLKGSKPLKQVTSPKGALYVLVGMDKKTYDDVMKESLDDSYKNDKSKWNKLGSEENFKDLKDTLVSE